MTDFKSFVIELVRLSIVDPRAAARTVLNLDFSREILWMMALLVVILSVILTYVTMLVAEAVSVSLLGVGQTPLFLAFFMAANMVFLIFALFWTGKILGGTGTINGFIAVVTWLQSLLLMAQVVQSGLSLFSAQLSSVFGLATLFYGLWILIQFITEAHQFPHWGKGFAVLVLAIVGVSAGISLILGVIGVSTLGLSGYV